MALILSVGFLTSALVLGGAKLIFDIFNEGLKNVFDGIWVKVVLILLSYAFGWISAVVGIRVYGNLLLPSIIRIYITGCLIGVCGLYVVILQRLFYQGYDMQHYIAYVVILAGSLAAMVGLHLILERHDLRPLSLPLLFLTLIQFGLMIIRYMYTLGAKPEYLFNDLFLFFVMMIFSLLMLAHTGILNPFRRFISSFFAKNSVIIRPEE